MWSVFTQLGDGLIKWDSVKRPKLSPAFATCCLSKSVSTPKQQFPWVFKIKLGQEEQLLHKDSLRMNCSNFPDIRKHVKHVVGSVALAVYPSPK